MIAQFTIVIKKRNDYLLTVLDAETYKQIDTEDNMSVYRNTTMDHRVGPSPR